MQKIDLAAVHSGIVCFTFDDGKFETWLPQRELFRRYQAHATFFYSGQISEEAIASMKLLQQDGHSVGLHGIHHWKAPQFMESMGAQPYFDEEIRPQLEAVKTSGVSLHHYAFPNNSYDEKSIQLLQPYFRHFRAGIRPAPAEKGYRISEAEQAFYPLSRIAGMPVLGGSGIGPYYFSTQENIDAALEKAARENKLIVFYSHAILAEPRGVHMSISMLEASLKKASSLGMKIAGFDELP